MCQIDIMLVCQCCSVSVKEPWFQCGSVPVCQCVKVSVFQCVIVPECPCVSVWVCWECQCAGVSPCGCVRVGVSICLCVDVSLCLGPSAYCLMHAGRINLFVGGGGRAARQVQFLFLPTVALRLSTSYYCYHVLKRQR
jgi:hypothetical protein